MSVIDDIVCLVKERDEYKRLCGHILATIQVNFHRNTLHAGAGYEAEWERVIAGWRRQVDRIEEGTK